MSKVRLLPPDRMKEHVTYIRYFTIDSDEVDRKTGAVTVIPQARDVVIIQNKKDQNIYYVVERVVWLVGKLATEVQVRLLPYTKV